MKQGDFFTIPERPSDVDLLRRQATTLQSSTRPAWLPASDIDDYRYLGCASSAGLADPQSRRLAAEIEQLELAGIVVEHDPHDPAVQHAYIRSEADYDNWSIGMYHGSSLLDLHPTSAPVNPVLTRDDISDVPTALVADPFMVLHEGQWFMFFELFNWRANKGEIGLATSVDGMHWSYVGRVLVEPFHLSYPHVFQHQSEYFMIPESRQCGAVRLYRATDFPAKWECIGSLLESKSFVDATPYYRDGRWWMLVGDSSRRNHDTLRLFLSASLTSGWREHPSSPIVVHDPHSARPAGRVVVDEPHLYRLAQNCFPNYGLDVRVFEITELTPHVYRDKPVLDHPLLYPSGTEWSACGMHHMDAQQLDNGSWLACVDGWTNQPDRSSLDPAMAHHAGG